MPFGRSWSEASVTGWHIAPRHAPPWQEWLQLPQLFESVLVSTHAPEHAICPCGHMHVQPMQEPPPGPVLLLFATDAAPPWPPHPPLTPGCSSGAHPIASIASSVATRATKPLHFIRTPPGSPRPRSPATATAPFSLA